MPGVGAGTIGPDFIYGWLSLLPFSLIGKRVDLMLTIAPLAQGMLREVAQNVLIDGCPILSFSPKNGLLALYSSGI